MSYNLMRVFEEISKTQQPELIHPSDKKYSEALEIRQQQAQKRDRFVNPLFFQARISRISSYTIRAVQNAIITGMSLQCFMSSLVIRGVAIFAKACFGHPSPSKQQKLNATTYASGGPDSSSSPRPDPTRGRNIGSK
ncbi:transposase, IS4 family [Bathymodiolus platifrons methanotrophic gill symbiont]|uniref:hypothetical protein n=1 Tax=Bathymodiolus platifrons methanotrophic gill symbiont TaxID=113268 RepID=UPI001B77E2B9|nr:hypothetical protein [Bathymodiolus platifrons methanotrophic gill symbiont]GFO76574.1 transposase, IS4 family [Bathymodiolus platifrons methanotrophic gill symbiont]